MKSLLISPVVILAKQCNWKLIDKTMDQDIKLHANNKSFSWSIPEGPYRYFSKEDIDCFNENGFVVVDDAFSPSEIAEVIDRLSVGKKFNKKKINLSKDAHCYQLVSLKRLKA